MSMRFFALSSRFCWRLCALSACLRPALAHPLQVEPVIITIHPQQTFLSAIITGNIQDITVGCDITPAERVRATALLSPPKQRVEKYVNDHFQMKIDGTPLDRQADRVQLPGPDGPDQISLPPVPALRKARVPPPSSSPRPAPAKAAIRPAPVKAYGPPAMATPEATVRPVATATPAGKGVLTLTSTLFDYLPNSKTVISINGIQKTLMHGEATTIDPSQLAVNLLHNLYDFMRSGHQPYFYRPRPHAVHRRPADGLVHAARPDQDADRLHHRALHHAGPLRPVHRRHPQPHLRHLHRPVHHLCRRGELSFTARRAASTSPSTASGSRHRSA